MAFGKDFQTRAEAADLLRVIADQIENKDDGQYVSFKLSVVSRSLPEIEKMQMRALKKEKVEV